MEMYSFQDLASKIKERRVPSWADLWDITELTSHGATILGRYCYYPLLRQWHKSLMLDSFMLIQVHVFAIIAEGEELQESLLSLDHTNIARRHRQVACDLHISSLILLVDLLLHQHATLRVDQLPHWHSELLLWQAQRE